MHWKTLCQNKEWDLCSTLPSKPISTQWQDSRPVPACTQTVEQGLQFQKISAEVYKEEYVRDTFISGLTKARIRLLENTTLTLDDAYNQARALELAEQQSASYTNPTLPDVTASQDTAPVKKIETTAATPFPSPKTCYFCGKSSCLQVRILSRFWWFLFFFTDTIVSHHLSSYLYCSNDLLPTDSCRY